MNFSQGFFSSSRSFFSETSAGCGFARCEGPGMVGQVAASQYDAQGQGHSFVLRRPLSRVTAKRCADCGADIFMHSSDEVGSDDLRVVLDVCADTTASAIGDSGLFVGGFKAALSHARADDSVCVANTAGVKLHDFLPKTRSGFDVLRAQGRVKDLEWDDSDDFVLDEDEIADACRWIAARLDVGTGVVVNCAQGKSRSGTLATAFLMFHRDMALGEALRLVQASRPYVSPNRGFLRQLASFEPVLRKAGIAARQSSRRA